MHALRVSLDAEQDEYRNDIARQCEQEVALAMQDKTWYAAEQIGMEKKLTMTASDLAAEFQTFYSIASWI
jgi:hypothetical protein